MVDPKQPEKGTAAKTKMTIWIKCGLCQGTGLLFKTPSGGYSLLEGRFLGPCVPCGGTGKIAQIEV